VNGSVVSGHVSNGRSFRRLAAASVLAALGFAVFCTLATLRDHYTTPHADDWRLLDDLFKTSLADWIFADHVGHRIPLTLFLLYLDYTYLSGHMHLLVIGSLLCAWVAAGALYVAFRAEPGARSPTDRVVYAFCVFCLFWAGSGFDFVWGANQGSQQTVMLFSIALAALAVHQSRTLADPTRRDVRLPVVAGVAAFLATFSHGMGAATWAGLVFASIVAGLRWRLVAGLTAAGAASVVLYGRGLEHVPGGTLWIYLFFLRRQVVRIAQFWLSFIGCPAAHVAGTLGGFEKQQYFAIGSVGGAVGLAIFVVYVAYVWRRRPRLGGVEVLCAGLMAFTLAGGVLVALNRFMFPASAVSDRFLTWTTLFWMGALGAIVRLARDRAWGAGFAFAVLSLVSLAMLPALGKLRAGQEGLRQKFARESAMHLSRVRWDQLAQVGIKRDPDAVYRVVERMRRDRHTFFSDGRGDLVGTPLARHYALAADGRCSGTITSLKPVEARDGPAAMLTGTIRGGGAQAAPTFVLLADSSGVIRGLGEIDSRRSASEGASWVGFIGGFDAAASYTAYGAVAGERAVCSGPVWNGGRAGQARRAP
jgi:hypothetical protein